MFVIDSQNPEWTDDIITCLFCKSTYQLRADDKPEYASKDGVRLGSGEYWELNWTCPTCGQLIVQNKFFKYPKREQVSE